jgi:hypothetical protein
MSFELFLMSRSNGLPDDVLDNGGSVDLSCAQTR